MSSGRRPRWFQLRAQAEVFVTLHGSERISYMMEKRLEEDSWGNTYHRGDFPSYMMEKTLDNALLRWLGRMSVTLTVDTGTARRLFNYGHRLR